MLGQVAGLAVETIKLVVNANQELGVSDHVQLAVTAAALQEKVRVFRKLTAIPISDWPSPSLATDFDMALEHLLEVTEGIHLLPQAIRMATLSNERWIEFVQRSGVFGHRADSLLQQVAFHKEVNERGPGLIVRLFGDGKIFIELEDQPRPGYRLVRWSIQRAHELSTPPAPMAKDGG